MELRWGFSNSAEDWMKNVYEGRCLSEGFPELEKRGVEYFQKHQESEPRVLEIFECLEHLINLDQGMKTVCVVRMRTKS